MGIVTSLTRATGAQLDHFIAHPEDLNEFLWRPERLEPPSGYLDKSVDAIQAMLDASSVRLNLAPTFMPGEPIIDRLGGVYFALYPKKIQAMVDVLAAVPRDNLAVNFNRDDRDYALYNYDKLVKFLQHASNANLGAVMSHN